MMPRRGVDQIGQLERAPVLAPKLIAVARSHACAAARQRGDARQQKTEPSGQPPCAGSRSSRSRRRRGRRAPPPQPSTRPATRLRPERSSSTRLSRPRGRRGMTFSTPAGPAFVAPLERTPRASQRCKNHLSEFGSRRALSRPRAASDAFWDVRLARPRRRLTRSASRPRRRPPRTIRVAAAASPRRVSRRGPRGVGNPDGRERRFFRYSQHNSDAEASMRYFLRFGVEPATDVFYVVVANRAGNQKNTRCPRRCSLVVPRRMVLPNISA